MIVIGGWLLLPMTGYDPEGLPEFTKTTAIALGLVLGGWVSGKRWQSNFKWRIHDVPMILWCLSAIPSSLNNQLGLYDGLSGAFDQFITWGIPYLAGRIYFDNFEKIKDLCLGIVIGGLFYLPLCLYEFRMSPRLSINIYGFFPHEWRQHYRHGFWRPVVFMQHGLMVALWMASAATASFWLWRGRLVEAIAGVSMPFIFMALATTSVLCLSGNGWFALGIGCAGYTVYNRFGTAPLVLLLISIPLYAFLRANGVATAYIVETAAGYFFSAERVSSLGKRLLQEDLFVRRAMENFLFGAGRASLAWPVDPVTGRLLIKMVDPLWLIAFSFKGVFGLITYMIAMLMGPWVVFRNIKKNVQSADSLSNLLVLLGLIVTLFMIDCLVNAMINPIYIMSAGALVCMFNQQRNSLKCQS